MRRLGAVGLALFSGLLATASIGTAAAEETPNASDCIGFEKNENDHNIQYSIENVCERKLSCRVSWKLTCEDKDGKATAKSTHKANVSLDASGSTSVTASAESCKQGWRIDDVSWSCQQG
jgi:hypothetical protein